MKLIIYTYLVLLGIIIPSFCTEPIVAKLHHEEVTKVEILDKNSDAFVMSDPRYKKIIEYLMDYVSESEAIKTALLVIRSDDPILWASIAVAESGCNSEAVSSEGAQGKWQVMPSWKKKPGFEFYAGRNSHLDDAKNFKAAQKVMKIKLAVAKNNKWLAVERYCGAGPDARAYVAKVRRIYTSMNS